MLKKVFIVFLFSCSHLSFSKTKHNSLSFNFGELGEKAILSKVLGGTSSGWFIPLHFHYAHYLNETYSLAAEYIYRFDNHGTFDYYHENLIQLGVDLQVKKNHELSLLVGGGKVRGLLNETTLGVDMDFVSGIYSCNQLTTQASYKITNELNENWDLKWGGGVLIIYPTSCENEIAMSLIGTLVHRIVPLFHGELAYRF